MTVLAMGVKPAAQRSTEYRRAIAAKLRGAMFDVRRRVHAMEQGPIHVVRVSSDENYHVHVPRHAVVLVK